MRRPFLSLLVLVALLVGADYLAKDYVAGQVEAELQRGFETRQRPDVSIDAFPFLVAALSGRFDGFGVQAQDVKVERITFADVRLDLRQVTFSLGEVLSGRAERVAARSGEGTATLTGEALTRIVARESPDIEVTVQGDSVTISTPQAPAPAVARVALRRNSLILTADSGLDEIAIPLPQITSGLDYQDVSVADSAVVLSFRLVRPRLEFQRIRTRS